MTIQIFTYKKVLSVSLIIMLAIAISYNIFQHRQLKNTQQDEFNVLIQMLKIYKVYDQNGEIELLRFGSNNDRGYVIAEKALKSADVCMGYGIADDITFEEQFSNYYHKPSYGFDCSISGIHIKNKLCTFVPQCIANDSYIYKNKLSSTQTATFSNQINALKLQGKKIFLKMDIEGAEYDAFEDIYKHVDSITGIAMEVHFKQPELVIKLIRLLSELQKDFYLINVHGNNRAKKYFTTPYSKGPIPQVLELTFINKKLVTKPILAKNQSFPSSLDMPDDPKREDAKFEILN